MLDDFQCTTSNCLSEEEIVPTSSLRYVVEGTQSLRTDQRSISMPPNSVLFIEGGTKIQSIKGSLAKGISILVSPSFDLKISRILGVFALPICGDERIDMIQHLHQPEGMSELKKRARLRMTLERYITGQFASLNRLTQRSKQTRMESLFRLTLARQYLDMNMTRQLSIDELTDVAFLSKYELIRRFKQAFGETPYRYYLTRKVQATKADLVSGKSLSEIVNKYEFADTFSYSKLFKTTIGVNPSTYRSSVQKHSHQSFIIKSTDRQLIASSDHNLRNWETA